MEKKETSGRNESQEIIDANSPANLGPFIRRVIIATSIVATTILLSLVLWYAADLFLFAFAGILFGIFLNGIASSICGRFSLGYRKAYLLAVSLFFLGLALGALLIGPQLVDQVRQLQAQLPQFTTQFEQYLNQHELGRFVLSSMPQLDALARQALSWLPRVFSATFGVLGSVMVVLFFGIYLGANPEIYRAGLLHLIPHSKRQRVREVLRRSRYVMWRWLLGRFVSMLMIGLITTIGLWLLDVPLPLTLGVLAGVLDFIPVIGPIIAAVPAVLLALTQNPVQAAYVVAFYVIVQGVVEAYLLMPFIENKAVYLPPALVLAGQLLFFLLFGFLGMLLSTPLLVVLVVSLQMLYVRDVLRDKMGA